MSPAIKWADLLLRFPFGRAGKTPAPRTLGSAPSPATCGRPLGKQPLRARRPACKMCIYLEIFFFFLAVHHKPVWCLFLKAIGGGMEMSLQSGTRASRQLVGLGVQPTVPAPDGGSLEKEITSVQDPHGDFWVSLVFFVHKIGLNARGEKFVFLCIDPRSNVSQPHLHSAAAPLAAALPKETKCSTGNQIPAAIFSSALIMHVRWGCVGAAVRGVTHLPPKTSHRQTPSRLHLGRAPSAVPGTGAGC